MAIVDTFTKLIFGQESEYSSAEMEIIDALRRVDDNVSLDDHHELGIYLRALGVKEMIKLVAQVRVGLNEYLTGNRPSSESPDDSILPCTH